MCNTVFCHCIVCGIFVFLSFEVMLLKTELNYFAELCSIMVSTSGSEIPVFLQSVHDQAEKHREFWGHVCYSYYSVELSIKAAFLFFIKASGFKGLYSCLKVWRQLNLNNYWSRWASSSLGKLLGDVTSSRLINFLNEQLLSLKK